MFALDLAVGLLPRLGLFKCRQLLLGQNSSFLGRARLQSLQALAHVLKVVAKPDRAHAARRHQNPATRQLVRSPLLAKSRVLNRQIDNRFFNILGNTVLNNRFLFGNVHQRLLAALGSGGHLAGVALQVGREAAGVCCQATSRPGSRKCGREHIGVVRSLETGVAWVGLRHLENAYPPSLSGGERQRAALARALINAPDIILADEPTGNVDWAMAERLLQMLVELNKMGKTIILATHDLNLIRAAKSQVTAHVLRIKDRQLQQAEAAL